MNTRQLLSVLIGRWVSDTGRKRKFSGSLETQYSLTEEKSEKVEHVTMSNILKTVSPKHVRIDYPKKKRIKRNQKDVCVYNRQEFLGRFSVVFKGIHTQEKLFFLFKRGGF